MPELGVRAEPVVEMQVVARSVVAQPTLVRAMPALPTQGSTQALPMRAERTLVSRTRELPMREGSTQVSMVARVCVERSRSAS